MNVSTIFRTGPAGLALMVALAGCGPSSSKSNPGHPLPVSHLVAKCEPGQPGGRFVIGAPASPRTFNPLFAFDTASDNIVRLLNASLVTLDQSNQEPRPALAESWSQGPDQKTWTFKLRPGLRWNDGVLLTADDVVFTWNQIMYDRDCNRATFDLFRINGKNFEVTSLDSFTVRVVTPEIFAPFLEFFGTTPILPRHALELAVQQRRFPAAFSTNAPPVRIIGCGPYRLKEFQHGKFTLLERNPDYWVADRAGRRLPYLDEVMFTVGGGRDAEAELCLAGQGDVCETLRPEMLDRFKQISAKGRCQVLDLGLGAERDFLWFNQNTLANPFGKPIVPPAKLKWFRNKKFRQAVSCAIDRDRLVRDACAGRAYPTYSLISTENQKWNNPNLPRYAFDVAKARALLAEIGMKDRNADGILVDSEGVPVEILFCSNTGNPLRERTAAMIVEDLQKVGIKLVYTPVTFQALVEKINATGDYECALMGLGGGAVDPASQMNVLRSSEDLHQWFPRQPAPSTEWEARIDALMDGQMRTLDFAERKKAFDEVQAILAEELPMIYTVSPAASAAIRAGVANLRPSVLTPYRLTWNLEELYFTTR